MKKGRGRREKRRRYGGGEEREVTGNSAEPGSPSLGGQFSAFRYLKVK
jgi:hypothetical protein